MVGSPLPIRARVPEDLAGERIDVVICRLAPALSRRAARRLVSDGSVTVDGRRVRVLSRTVAGGAMLEIAVPAPRPPTEAIPLLALDAALAVVDKPARMPTSPTRQASRGTVTEELGRLLRDRGEDVRFLAAVHRLDTDTTGVLVVARSPEAARIVGEQLRDGRAVRRYLALVDGVVSFQTRVIDASLVVTQGQGGRLVRVARAGEAGKAAVTHVTVLATSDRASLLLCAPQTGRTHQLRVHLASIGHPLVGDRRYRDAPAPSAYPHLGLHARSLAIAHPIDGRPVAYVAPPPPAFVDVATSLALANDVIRRHASSEEDPPPLEGDAR